MPRKKLEDQTVEENRVPDASPEMKTKATEKETQERMVSFNQNVKFGNDPYMKGHKIKVNGVDYETLLKAGLIDMGEDEE